MWRNEMKDLIYKWVERFSVHGSGLKRPNWMLAKGNHSGGGCPTIAFRFGCKLRRRRWKGQNILNVALTTPSVILPFPPCRRNFRSP